MGRAAGGRAATRGTRAIPELTVNHGAPAFEARTQPFQALCEQLATAGTLSQVAAASFGSFGVDGTFRPDAPTEAPIRYVASSGSMNALSDALLRGGNATGGDPLAAISFGTMVGALEPLECGGGWRLKGKKGELLGDFDWVVVSSSTIAHPRWTSTFGGEAPLIRAAAVLGDAPLDASLAQLAQMRSSPVTA